MDHKLANEAAIDKAAHASIHGGKKGHSLFESVIRTLTGK